MKLGETQSFASPEEALAHVSETPWSDYTKADYTLEQWHAACLIHIHDGDPTSKSQCKLPVKTPDGVLNRNGVHAAAAALAGARGGLKDVSADQKKTAGNALKRYYAQLDEDPPESLSHHGVRGMKWGVRKEEDTGEGRSSSQVSAAAYHRLADDIVNRAGIDSRLAMEKYGSATMQATVDAQRQRDRERLKKVAIGAGIGIGIAAAGFAVYKVNQVGGFEDLPKISAQKIAEFKKITGEVGTNKEKLEALFGTKFQAYNHGVEGLNINWENGVDLPKGSIIRRLSSVAETTPRPDGFYGAFRDEDIDSYKAILPTFWQGWGVGSAEKGGFLNHYMAKEAIRAPSGKESFEMFKKLLGTDDNYKEIANMFLPNGGHGASEQQLKDFFLDLSANWAISADDLTQGMFKEARSRGYNALIDFNDAGKLGKTPIRVFDGNMFDIVKNEPQTLNDFYTAAKKWSPELVHIYTLENGVCVFIHVDDFVRTVELGHDAVEMMV